ncbi:MAG TPA: CHAT domain-containing protein, partial [Dehalococcoidia bacterium]|nr:CHAT domain-containing protein [Dehalococcoidia bacterium]
GGSHVRSLVRRLQATRDRYAGASARAADADTTGDAAGRATSVNELAQLEARITDLTRQIQLAAAGSEALDLLGPAPDVERPHLPQGTLLIEFFISGPDILRFRVDAGGVRGEVLPTALPEVERCLRLFRLNLDAVERAGPDANSSLTAQAQAILKRLYLLLLGGLSELDRYRSLVIVPHGLLHYLPFHALYDGERYLVERAPVSYVPSAALWEVCHSRDRRRRSGRALVLACSDNGRLPSTLTEAAGVAAVLGVPVHGDDSSARAELIAASGKADVIHIAAHGRFRADAPLFSHIQLADGQLTTADIFDLRLRARLVVLSACETARAVVGGGDELVGLTRAWLYAGAAGLVVSQWRVEDAATATLMRSFYRRFGRGAGAAAALREAQLEFIRHAPENGRSHPFYWAGFQTIGAGPRERARTRTQRTSQEERG